MERILNFIQKHKKYFYYAGGAIIMVLVGLFLLKNNNSTEATIIVSRTDFINQVAVSGKVETSSAADLGFAAGGRNGSIAWHHLMEYHKVYAIYNKQKHA